MKTLGMMMLTYAFVTLLTSVMIVVAFNRSNSKKYDSRYWDGAFNQLWDFLIWFTIVYITIVFLTALDII